MEGTKKQSIVTVIGEPALVTYRTILALTLVESNKRTVEFPIPFFRRLLVHL